MNKIVQRGARATIAAAFAAAALGFGPGTAASQQVVFSGSTLGCFGAGCTPVATQTIGGGGLTYTNSTFNVMVPATGAVSGLGDVAATPNVNNFGSFTLSYPPAFDYNSSFTLQVIFTAPTGSPTQTYAASFVGNISAGGNGLYFDFVNTPALWTIGNAHYSAFVNDPSVNTPRPTGTQTIAISGGFTATTVPEPASMLLIGSGLLGLGALRRRRKNS